MITKKEFKELCDIHIYGKGQDKLKVLYYDWSNNFETGIGFKYMMATKELTKQELINTAYDWIIKENNPSWKCFYAYAPIENLRFKVPITSNGVYNLEKKINKYHLEKV